MAFLAGKNKFPVHGRTVLITGGSQGMGRSVGRQLAEKGAKVIIVARNVARLQEAVAYLSEGRNPQNFHHISADLTTATECARVVSEATAWNNNIPPDIVWCCAGSSHPTLFIDTPPAELQNQMDSNYFSSAYMAHATLNAWLRPSSKTATARSPEPRHLIFTASFLSFYTIAGYAPYSPTKAALRSLSDTLSQEVLLYASTHTPVRLHTVFPAAIFTGSYEAENKIKSDLTKKLEEDDKGQTADEVAELSIKGLERGDELVTTTLLTRLVMTSVLGGSVRNGWGVLDTLLAWVMALVMVFVRGDMDGKVKRWGRENGVSGMKRGFSPRQHP